MTPIEIIGQTVGFIAIALAFVSFQARRRSSILLIQASANVFWAVHFFMIGTSPSGYLINIICIFRNVLYAQKERWRFVNKKIVPISMAIIATTISAIFAESWLDYLLIPSTIVSSFGFYLNDEKKIRLASIFVSVSWLIYNIIEFSISGTLAELFNITSIVIAMIRYSRLKSSLGKSPSASAGSEGEENGNETEFSKIQQ